MFDIAKVLKSIDQLPPLPEVSQKVLQLVNDPGSSASDIVAVVRHDQSITANVLRLCNSAYFGLKRRVDSLVQAVVLIGQNQLAELVMISSCIHLFRNEHKGYNMKKGELWRHAIACALLSQIILKKMGSAPDHGLYTAALLHDIGKVVLDNHMKNKYQQVISRIQEANVPFHVAEQETLGIDHAEVGAQIMESWNLPDNIVRGIRTHHRPEAGPGVKNFGSTIHLCDLLSLHEGIGRDLHETDAVTLKTLLKTAQLSEEFVDSCTQKLEEEMGKTAAIVGLV
ncbi:MAG: HDOD domain-containing protein [Thermodesulfobacteriota bacterium]